VTIPPLRILKQYCCIAELHCEEERDEEAVKAIQKCQEMQKKLGITHDDDEEEAYYRLLCSYVLDENAGIFGISEQLAKGVLQAAVPSACRVLGAEECANQVDDWHFNVNSKLAANKLPGWLRTGTFYNKNACP
jgi:hypothetical protein